ncbi:hypothetical protein [Tolypothrix sp. NIES-4075]|uniref:hypothetical protein n=1 Tax=Tolypothrix sp. NIES-4075 TaxID=2005459 RepID=UPI00135AB740|nr:hypothetical protein [Tolypothrix sp. NIES-4075]
MFTTVYKSLTIPRLAIACYPIFTYFLAEIGENSETASARDLTIQHFSFPLRSL